MLNEKNRADLDLGDQTKFPEEPVFAQKGAGAGNSDPCRKYN